MNKKFALSAVVVVALLGLGYFVLRPALEAQFANHTGELPASLDAAPEAGSADLPLPAPIEFKDTLVIMDHAYSVDGGPMVEAVCAQSDPAFTFATLKISERKIAELTCLEDYMGGIAIKVASQPPLYEKLGLKVSDAGGMSDLRAWIRRSSDGLTIDIATKWSQSDIDPEEAGQVHLECGASAARLTISGGDFVTFTKTDLEKIPEELVFNPPPSIEKCP